MFDQTAGQPDGLSRRAFQEALDRSFAVRVRQRRPITVAKTPTGMLFESDADWDGVRAGEVAQEGTVLLSPPDITRRRCAMAWANQLRPYYRLGPEHLHAPPIGPRFASGARVFGDIVPAQLAFPPRCCTCLAPPTHALIVEGLLPSQGPRWDYELAEPGSVERSREGDCKEVAGKQRVWCAVPSCAEHVRASTPVSLAVSVNGRGWISFRDERYGSQFAAMNGLRPRHPMWHNGMFLLLLFVPFLPWFGVLAWQDGAFGLAVAMLTVSLIGALWAVGRLPLHRWRAARRPEPPTTDPGSGRHTDLPQHG